MPAFAPALICGNNCKRPIASSLLLVVALLCVGCEDEADDELAVRHAQVHASLEAERTVHFATEWTLLHPNSDRQRHARRQLMRLRNLESRMPGGQHDESDVPPEDALDLQGDELDMLQPPESDSPLQPLEEAP